MHRTSFLVITTLAVLAGCGSAGSGLKEARTQYESGHFAEARAAADVVVADYAEAKEVPSARFVAAAATAAITVAALDAGEFDQAAREFREYDRRTSDPSKLSGVAMPQGKKGLFDDLSSSDIVQVRIDDACANDQCVFALKLPVPKSRGDLLMVRAAWDLPDDATVEPGVTFGGAVMLLGKIEPGGSSRTWLAGKVCASASSWSGWRDCEAPKVEGLTFSDAVDLVSRQCASTETLAIECSGAVADRAKAAEIQRISAFMRLDSMRGTELCANVERLATALAPDTYLLDVKDQPELPPLKWWDRFIDQQGVSALMVLAGMNVASKKASADLLPLNEALEGMGDTELVTGLKGSVRLLLLSFAVLGRDTDVTLSGESTILEAMRAAKVSLPQAYDAAGPLVTELRSTCADWKIPG